jgi:hypothetical protein
MVTHDYRVPPVISLFAGNVKPVALRESDMASEGLEFLASFEEITTIGINMPGCKSIMFYVDDSGVEKRVDIGGAKRVRIVTDAQVQTDHKTTTSMTTRGGS